MLQTLVRRAHFNWFICSVHILTASSICLALGCNFTYCIATHWKKIYLLYTDTHTYTHIQHIHVQLRRIDLNVEFKYFLLQYHSNWLECWHVKALQTHQKPLNEVWKLYSLYVLDGQIDQFCEAFCGCRFCEGLMLIYIWPCFSVGRTIISISCTSGGIFQCSSLAVKQGIN